MCSIRYRNNIICVLLVALFTISLGNAFLVNTPPLLHSKTSAAISTSRTKPLVPLSAQDGDSPSAMEKLAATFSQSAAVKFSKRYQGGGPTFTEESPFNIITLFRVGIPSVIGGIFATLVFPGLAVFLASVMNDAGVFAVLSQDSSQFVQNFLTVSGLLFSILVGQT